MDAEILLVPASKGSLDILAYEIVTKLDFSRPTIKDIIVNIK
jgi:hypothetical protein